MPGIIDLNSVQVIDKIPARFPPWPDINSPFLSETYKMFARPKNPSQIFFAGTDPLANCMETSSVSSDQPSLAPQRV